MLSTNRLALVILATITLAISAVPARATIIAPSQVIGTPSAPTINRSFGVLDAALNFGGPALTRDGIDFLNAGGLTGSVPNPLVITVGSLSVTMTSPGALSRAIVGSDDLFEREIFAGSVQQQLTVTGLNPSRDYFFQFLHGDNRTGDFNEWDRPVTFTDSENNLAQTDLLFGNAGGAIGKPFALIGVNVLGSTSLTYDMLSEAGNRGVSMSGLVIHSQIAVVPVPATFLLMGLGLAGLGYIRRKHS